VGEGLDVVFGGVSIVGGGGYNKKHFFLGFFWPNCVWMEIIMG